MLGNCVAGYGWIDSILLIDVDATSLQYSTNDTQRMFSAVTTV